MQFFSRYTKILWMEIDTQSFSLLWINVIILHRTICHFELKMSNSNHFLLTPFCQNFYLWRNEVFQLLSTFWMYLLPLARICTHLSYMPKICCFDEAWALMKYIRFSFLCYCVFILIDISSILFSVLTCSFR